MSRVLTELVFGKHAHADSLACIDVSAEIAGQLPKGLPHSIWQLLWHMNYWMDHELRRIAGSPSPYPEHAAGSWPDPTPPDPAPWHREVRRFSELLGQLAELGKATAEELARPVATTHRSEAEHASTLEAVVWQTIVHNSYHLGQVVSLRQALGAWPPERGSDTW